jgi:hypothetical protein
MAMEDSRRQSGFSLIETMLAVGTLAIGMVFVAGTFMAGVYFASVSTERMIATVVTDEALAKITLYGLDPNDAKLKIDGFVPYEDLCAMDANEFCYPSVTGQAYREYSWSALCRRARSDSRLVEFTIFISRLAGPNASYWLRSTAGDLPTQTNPMTKTPPLPRPVLVHVVRAAGTLTNQMSIQDAGLTGKGNESAFIDSGSTFVDDATGQIYRVLNLDGNVLTIDPQWRDTAQTAATDTWVWVVPRPVSGGRNPLVTVYQRVIRF